MSSSAILSSFIIRWAGTTPPVPRALPAPCRGRNNPPADRYHVSRRKRWSKDPVCGMTIDEKTAAGKSEYQGQTYYFCAAICKTKFDQDRPIRHEATRRQSGRAED